MRDRRTLAAFAVSAVLLVPLGVFGAPALATSVQSSSAQYQYGTTKVTICHRTGSANHPYVKITISMAGWLNGHKKHSGDILLTDPTASCPTSVAAPSSTTTTTSTTEHGKSGEHHGKP